jgi:hypothetical protein
MSKRRKKYAHTITLFFEKLIHQIYHYFDLVFPREFHEYLQIYTYFYLKGTTTIYLYMWSSFFTHFINYLRTSRHILFGRGETRRKKKGGQIKRNFFKKFKILNILQRERLKKNFLQGPGPLPASPCLRHCSLVNIHKTSLWVLNLVIHGTSKHN